MFWLLMLAVGFVGACVGGEFCAQHFGILGGIVGTLVCGGLGLWVGTLPYGLTLLWIKGQLERKSVEQLRQELRRPLQPIPNLLLLELKSRGQDIEPDLPVVLKLLVSPRVEDRARGLAALESAFPDRAERLQDYRVRGPLDACHREVDKLSASPDDPQIPNPDHSPEA